MRPGGTLVDWRSKLTSKVDEPVQLDGDPQHAGFHFRADQEVAATTKAETYYLRPDGKGRPGETRNWDPKTKQGPVNLPWDAMSFVVGGKRYTAARDHWVARLPTAEEAAAVWLPPKRPRYATGCRCSPLQGICPRD